MAEPQQTPPANPDAATGSRRRSSGWMPTFESLSNQKHGNESNVARRASMTDQAPKTGILGQFFHNNFGRNAK